jgi:hypothetical protein
MAGDPGGFRQHVEFVKPMTKPDRRHLTRGRTPRFTDGVRHL